MPKIEITSAKGLVQSTGTTMPLALDESNSLIKIAFVDNTNAFIRDSDSIVTWTQPANTYIDSIDLLCTVAPVHAAGASFGYEVGTVTSEAQIVATQPDEIIDVGNAGNDLAVGALVRTAIVRVATDATTLVADASYTTAARSIFLNTTADNGAAVTSGGTMRWVIKYVCFAA